MVELSEDMQRLAELLQKAEDMLGDRDRIIDTAGFYSINDLVRKLCKCRTMLENSDPEGIYGLLTIFAPTGVWDDSVGAQGAQVADEVCSLASHIGKEVRRQRAKGHD